MRQTVTDTPQPASLASGTAHARAAMPRLPLPSRRWLGALLGLATVAAVLLRLQALTGAAAAVEPPGGSAVLQGRHAHAPPAQLSGTSTSAAEGVALLRRFALNALLLPLMDDAEPPRWSTAALELTCGPGTRVLVDGRPLQDGAPVPAVPFRLQWQMDGCRPLGANALQLDGGVLLTVAPLGDRLEAVLQPRQLRVGGTDGSAAVAGGFGASIAWR